MTGAEPLKSIYARIPGVAKKPGLLDASIFVGMAWSDVPRASMSVMVVAQQPSFRKAAMTEAQALAGRLWEKRAEIDKFDVPTDTLDGAITTALKAAEKPVLITDSGDNVTAGTPGDTTLVLKRLQQRGVKDAVVAGIVDAEAVGKCDQAGVGHRVRLKVGGKLDQVHGNPLAIAGTVRYLSPPGKNATYEIIPGVVQMAGRTAVVDVNGILVALLTVPRSFTALDQFQEVGIDPLSHKIIVVKQGYPFPGLRKVASRAIMALTPGCADQMVGKLPYKKIRRPIYPLDPDMTWPD